MPEFVQFHYDHALTLRLRARRVRCGMSPDPIQDRRGRNTELLGDGIHRQAQRVQQHSGFLLPQRLAARRLETGLSAAILALPFRHTISRTILDQVLALAVRAHLVHGAPLRNWVRSI